MRSLLAAVALVVVLGACSGGGDLPPSTPTATAERTPVPTATPFATLPEPLIVSDATPVGGSRDVTYVVQAGDSLLALATRFETSVEAIQRANDLSGSDIFVGQQLVIPSSDAGEIDEPAETPENGSGNTYTVEAGDTALGIAFRFDVTLEELAAANGMTTDEITNLQVGQTLQLPE